MPPNSVRLVAALGALTLASMSHAVTVNFSGQIPASSAGPFNTPAPFVGSFVLDESVLPTDAGGGNYNFIGAVDSFTLTVTDALAGNISFTGQDGLLTQQIGLPENIIINLGGANGTIAPNSFQADYLVWPSGTSNGTFSLSTVALDLRGDDVFASANIIASNLQTGDFDSFRRLTLNFSGPLDAHATELSAVSGGGIVAGNANDLDFSYVQFSGATTLPEPPAYAALVAGLSILILRRYRQTLNIASAGPRRRTPAA